MAVVWSWAFGAETHAILTDMGFSGYGTYTSQAPTSTAADIYTYPAFPGTKYSWSTPVFKTIQTPTSAGWTDEGTVAVAIKANTDWYDNAIVPLIKVNMPLHSINVYCTNRGTGTITLYVGTTLVGTTTLTVNDWHYLALKYDVSTPGAWTAELWVNNPASATIPAGGLSYAGAAQTSGFYESGGFSQTALALTAQFIVYDSATAIATAKVPYFVSRIAPTADTGEVGTWAPSTGGTNYGVTDGDGVTGFDKTTYTREATPSSSENVVTQTPALNVALGVVSGSVLGATNHTWSSGTAIQCKAYVGVGGSFSSGGATVTPDAADPTYAFDTSPTAGSGAVGASDVIELKYQIV